MSKGSKTVKNNGIFATRVSRGNLVEVFVTIPAVYGEEPEQVFHRLNDFLCENPDSRVVKMTVFGAMDFIKTNDYLQYTYFDISNWPVSWVGTQDDCSYPIAGIQVHAVEDAIVETIKVDGQVMGTVFEDSYARYCLLGNVLPDDAGVGRGEQTEQVFRKWKLALGQAGLGVCDIARTWLFLDDILSWYSELNRVRDEIFSREGLYDGVVPASTGVSGSNPMGAALTTELIAIRSKTEDARSCMVPSPLQYPALEYGSSFSRAVEFTSPVQQKLYVSGTASISLDGDTLHEGDVEAQIAVTMQVVRAILESRGMGWSDVSRAIAYIKKRGDIDCFDDYCEQNKLSLPVIVTQGDICRDDLLFEMEVDAIKGEKVGRA